MMCKHNAESHVTEDKWDHLNCITDRFISLIESNAE